MEYAWIIFAILSAIFASLVAVFGKLGLTNVDSNTATAIRAIIMAILLITVVFIEGKLLNFSKIFANNTALKYIILSGIAGALSWLFYFLALKYGTIHQVVTIDRLSVVFAVILGIIFLGESISPASILGIALVIIGSIIVAMGS